MNGQAGFDPEASVIVTAEVDIDVPQGRVWTLLSEPSRWPRWFSGVRFASLQGPLAPGSSLQWQADGLRISSILLEVDPERSLEWSLRMMGGRGGMRWTLEPLPSGGTLVRVEESWGGAVVWILRRTLRRTLEKSRRAWLTALEVAANRAEIS